MQSEGPVRVLAVENETLPRKALADLGGQSIEMVAVYPTVEELLDAGLDAEVVLLDLWLGPRDVPDPGLQGLDAVEELVARGYRVLLHTIESRREVLAGLVKAGASGVVLKDEPLHVLADSIRTVGDGGVALTKELTYLAELVYRRGLLPSLTDRKAEILALRAKGMSYRTIAKICHVSPKTVEKAVSEINSVFIDYLHRTPVDDLPFDTAFGDRPSAAVIARTFGLGEGDLMGRRGRTVHTRANE